MQVSAEHPLVGNDAASDKAHDSASNAVHAKNENEQFRPRNEDISIGFRFEPPRKRGEAPDADNDGPIIRRIDGKPQARPDAPRFDAPKKRDLRTPRLFPQQSRNRDFAPPEPPSASVPAMEESLLGDSAESHPNGAAYRASNTSFSVAAIRAKRMRKPAGTHKPTSLATKLVIATFVGITCVSSGITLGLYGPELGYQLERQARLAGVSVAGLLTWPGSDTAKPVQANIAAATPQQPAPVKVATTSAGYSKPAAATGSKRYYDRILPSKPRTSASLDRANAAQAKLTGLEKHLSVPLDLQSFQIKQVSASTE